MRMITLGERLDPSAAMEVIMTRYLSRGTRVVGSINPRARVPMLKTSARVERASATYRGTCVRSYITMVILERSVEAGEATSIRSKSMRIQKSLKITETIKPEPV